MYYLFLIKYFNLASYIVDDITSAKAVLYKIKISLSYKPKLVNSFINPVTLLEQKNPAENKCCFFKDSDCFTSVFIDASDYFICRFRIFDYIITQEFSTGKGK